MGMEERQLYPMSAIRSILGSSAFARDAATGTCVGFTDIAFVYPLAVIATRRECGISLTKAIGQRNFWAGGWTAGTLLVPYSICVESLSRAMQRFMVGARPYQHVRPPPSSTTSLSAQTRDFQRVGRLMRRALSPSLPLSLPPSLSPSIHLSIYLYLYLSIYLSLYISISLNLYLSLQDRHLGEGSVQGHMAAAAATTLVVTAGLQPIEKKLVMDQMLQERAHGAASSSGAAAAKASGGGGGGKTFLVACASDVDLVFTCASSRRGQ